MRKIISLTHLQFLVLFVLNIKAHWAAKQELYCTLVNQSRSSEIRWFSDTCLFYIMEHFWNACSSTIIIFFQHYT